MVKLQTLITEMNCHIAVTYVRLELYSIDPDAWNFLSVPVHLNEMNILCCLDPLYETSACDLKSASVPSCSITELNCHILVEYNIISEEVLI
jgi:hypothetical protein